MAHAYTPGLRVTPGTALRRTRRLPMKGEVLVHDGDVVQRQQVVARTELPGNVRTMNVVNRLGISAEELPDFMLKNEGDPVHKGDAIAETRPLIKWFKTTVEAEIDGTAESISAVTGQVLLREPPLPVEVLAYVDGTVVEIIPDEGVVVETRGAFVQGIFGIGGEAYGPLHVISTGPGQDLTPEAIDEGCAGRIVVATGLVPHAAIDKARQVGAAGVIGAGIHDSDLRQLLGYDLGVAITGAEDIGLTVILTEGFGRIAMAGRTFDILRDCHEREASLSGATQIRAGVMRPEIIVPDPDGAAQTEATPAGHGEGMGEGDALRVIRAPYFGRIGKVGELIADLQQVESGAAVRVLEVEFEDGTRAVVPRANVELIEE
ncbi:MAG: hypothetical protein QF689_04980 [Candidatus Latescibacteria bacterium]|jgi:hypothetical protein|nr:hypothetical protein [Gemmatimonadaceae bacterium]MDP6014765.1 hypothetical protein [Candidatus Latescibacterota bacterium]MDP7447924.1 hypothetical protein [Candidatus Latescibacterota bacterium]HJP29757.1 hypothetical protein [Candidatus Latescibacterota bacterium]